MAATEATRAGNTFAASLKDAATAALLAAVLGFFFLALRTEIAPGGLDITARWGVWLTAIAVVFGMFNEGFDRLAVPHLLENYEFAGGRLFSEVVWIGGIRFVIELLGIGVLEIVRRRVDLASHSRVTQAL